MMKSGMNHIEHDEAAAGLAVGIHPVRAAGGEQRRWVDDHCFWSAMSSLRLSMPRMVKPSVVRSSVS